MATANERYRDGVLHHQIGVRRFTAGEVKRVLKLLEEADRDLTARLRRHLEKLAGRPLDFKGRRYQRMLADLADARVEALAQYRDLVRGDLRSLARIEAQAELGVLTAVIPFEIGLVGADAQRLQAILSSRPFQGRLLRDWFRSLERVDRERMNAQLQLGLVQGEPINDIVRRVAGSRATGYTDGVLAMTRRNAVAIVRTAVNHVSNNAREAVWEANADIITAKIWSSTLDGRTTAICRARDGCGVPVGNADLPEGIKPLKPPDAKPPAHFNCRSVFVAYIDGVGLMGNRPSISDTRTRRQREIDFRKLARQQGLPIQEVRRAWAAKHIGPVPTTTNYQDWLRGQSRGFQDDVLGKAKARLFRTGKLQLSEFVDRAGNELTLAQLADLKPDAFLAAGLDPGDF